MRESFYEVPAGAYLFGQQLNEGDEAKPEEQVRQWAAHELIRCYGILASNLEFERPVRIGSKTYRIDILVQRSGKPWIVVECKERANKTPEKTTEQAISYADERSIQAEFVVATNGTYWTVHRRIGKDWTLVPDLPARFRPERAQTGFCDVVSAFAKLEPILHKIDSDLDENEAECFLAQIQAFFCTANLLTDNVSPSLRHAIDNLLRPLARTGIAEGYIQEKTRASLRYFRSFLLSIGSAPHVEDDGKILYLPQDLAWLEDQLQEVSSKAPWPRGADLLLVRFSVSVLSYVFGFHRSGRKLVQIPGAFHQSLREFLDYQLHFHLNTQLPDTVDSHSWTELRGYCYLRWIDAVGEAHR